MVATLYQLFVCVPFICAVNPAVEDSKLSTDAHSPGWSAALIGVLLLALFFMDYWRL